MKRDVDDLTPATVFFFGGWLLRWLFFCFVLSLEKGLTTNPIVPQMFVTFDGAVSINFISRSSERIKIELHNKMFVHFLILFNRLLYERCILKRIFFSFLLLLVSRAATSAVTKILTYNSQVSFRSLSSFRSSYYYFQVIHYRMNMEKVEG